ncbi:hypothetical protein [Bradyrhizobium sp. SZCCHNRI3043]|uniref:hypothetical protein n=1 Tax=Bradyrhizobium sp. SZCCHNRI3043 TaxID=3057292 RepID=UPI0028F066C6|nr:hypothetical protein [Bradyrhizobium sp. SZCCHNRI3043]
MSNAFLIANIELWRLLPVGGIWKCRRMVASPEVRASVYADPCHRSANVFTCLLGSCRIRAAELATGRQRDRRQHAITFLAMAGSFQRSPEQPNLKACHTRSSSGLRDIAHLQQAPGQPQPD